VIAAPDDKAQRMRVVLTLGTTQTLAWASSYYLPAILAVPVARDLGVSPEVFFGAFSIALVISALVGPAVGRRIDRVGGRGVLCASNLVLAAGLVLLAASHSIWVMGIAWLLLGLGMGMGLYDAAFAALARIYGSAARGPITGITLLAGFASTLGWPLTAAAEAAWGWRSACLMWALVHLALCLPLNAWLLPRSAAHPPAQATDPGKGAEAHAEAQPWGLMALLAFVFAAIWFVTGAMGTHLPRLLLETGISPAQAVAYAALVGPAQVAARLAEFALQKHLHPVVSARIATTLHPLGYGVLLAFGAPGAAVFALLHGAGNGMVTIVKGTLPLALMGPKDYGYRSGLIGAPARFTQALSPLLFGFLVTRYGSGALIFSSALMLTAFVGLWFVARTQHRR
jgi:predicted MFS family arabinose efflux permease